jgi:hypothetical protein
MSRHLRVLLQAGIITDERTAQDDQRRVVDIHRIGYWLGVRRETATRGPDPLAAEGFGLFGGDAGCPGEDFGKQVQQACSLVLAEGSQDVPLDVADTGEQLIGGGAAVGCDLDQDAAPVAGVGDTADPAAVFEEVQCCRHGCRGDENPVADL